MEWRLAREVLLVLQRQPEHARYYRRQIVAPRGVDAKTIESNECNVMYTHVCDGFARVARGCRVRAAAQRLDGDARSIPARGRGRPLFHQHGRISRQWYRVLFGGIVHFSANRAEKAPSEAWKYDGIADFLTEEVLDIVHGPIVRTRMTMIF